MPDNQEKIETKEIEDEMRQSYLDYSMSVIVGRALPDARDGLKPVHRRILFTMLNLGLLHNKPFRKCARIVGDCLGRFHPHGDAAVYDALVRMAQEFSLRYPLIQGQGNFGSIDGDAPAAMRYCVAGDSLIITEKGLVEIGTMSDQENISLNVLSKDKKINHASRWFDSGNHPALKVTTSKGYSLTGTYNHPVLTLTTDITGKPIFSWKLLEEIDKGDFVVIDRSIDNFWPLKKVNLSYFYPYFPSKATKIRLLPKVLDEDLAFILGSFVSEGSTSENKIEFCNTDSNWIMDMEDAWQRVFPDSKLHKFKRKLSSYGKKEYARLECHCRHTIRFLREIGLENVKSCEKRIPTIILQSPKSVVASFLKSYFEGDGSISSARKMIELSCCSMSETLINGLQILLLRFGISSFKRFDRHRLIWKLCIRGKRNILRFYKEIGFLSAYKNKKLELILYNYKKDFSLSDYVPFIADYIRNITSSEFVSKNKFDRYSGMKKNYGQVTESLLKSAGIDYSLIFEYLLTYNYLFDQIISVEEAGIQKVFSIKVDSDCHSFISNGFISHNTEARLKKQAEDILEDLDKETVPFVPNFDASLTEPTVLPSKFPNLLANGSSGIAVGMATNIPPNNIIEVCDAIIALINSPDSDIFNYIKGPDFPTGAIIQGTAGLKHAYATGRGTIIVKAKTSIEDRKIIVTEIPYQTNKSLLIEQIADLVHDKVITGISDIRDESDRHGIRIIVFLKQDANPDIVHNQLMKHSRLQMTYGINMVALVNNQPKTLPLKEIMLEFIRYRKIIVRKRTEYDLKKAEEKAHILEGLIIALNNIDEVIQKIKKSKDIEEATNVLITSYTLTDIQAKAILDMRLQKLASLEQEKIKTEHKGLIQKIGELKEVLSDENKILGIIKDEIAYIKEEYGDDRKTEISEDEIADLEVEDLIKPEDMVVTITHSGYIKRISVKAYRQQRRGGKGIIAAKTKEDDFVEDLFIANTHDYILFFTNKGKVKWLKVHMVPEASRVSRGSSVANIIRLDEGEKVSAFMSINDFSKGFIVFGTKKGIVKKTPLALFSRPRKGGIIALALDNDDELVNVVKTDGNNEIILTTKEGMAVRFREDDIRPMGRAARGVIGIRLKQNDCVVDMVQCDDTKSLLTITERGYGKRTKIFEYRLISRGGSGVINLKCSEKTGKVVAVKSVTLSDQVIIISRNGIIIRTPVKDISEIGRATQGVKVMDVAEDDIVIAAAKIIKDEGNGSTNASDVDNADVNNKGTNNSDINNTNINDVNTSKGSDNINDGHNSSGNADS